MDPIQFFKGGTVGISDDLINFWEEFIQNKMANRRHFEKNGRPKSLWARYLMNHWLYRI